MPLSLLLVLFILPKKSSLKNHAIIFLSTPYIFCFNTKALPLSWVEIQARTRLRANISALSDTLPSEGQSGFAAFWQDLNIARHEKHFPKIQHRTPRGEYPT
jgi:hypothetical protein